MSKDSKAKPPPIDNRQRIWSRASFLPLYFSPIKSFFHNEDNKTARVKSWNLQHSCITMIRYERGGCKLCHCPLTNGDLPPPQLQPSHSPLAFIPSWIWRNESSLALAHPITTSRIMAMTAFYARPLSLWVAPPTNNVRLHFSVFIIEFDFDIGIGFLLLLCSPLWLRFGLIPYAAESVLKSCVYLRATARRGSTQPFKPPSKT